MKQAAYVCREYFLRENKNLQSQLNDSTSLHIAEMASIYWTAVFLLCWMVMVSVAGRRQLTKNPNHTKEQKRGT